MIQLCTAGIILLIIQLITFRSEIEFTNAIIVIQIF